MHAFTMDNLLKPTDGISHLNVAEPPLEQLSPTLLNYLVTLWLNTINTALPALVKQRYSTELRGKTLASIREEISESLNALLGEITGENAAIARSSFRNGNNQRRNYSSSKSYSSSSARQPARMFCPFCDAKNRPSDHFLSQCSFLPESDQRFFSSRARSRAVGVEEEEDLDEFDEGSRDPNRRVAAHQEVQAVQPTNQPTIFKKAGVRKVAVINSPCLPVWYDKQPVSLVVDTGAEANLMKLFFAKSLGVPIRKTTTSAGQADGILELEIAGEVHFYVRRGKREFKFDGLVAVHLEDDVIAGVPFQTAHDVYARQAKKCVYIGDEEIKYGAVTRSSKVTKVRLSKAAVMKVPSLTALLPGESLSLPVPEDFLGENEVALEPVFDSHSHGEETCRSQWLLPRVLESEQGHLKLVNESSSPVLLNPEEKVAIVRPVSSGRSKEESSMPVDVTPGLEVPAASPSFKDVSVDPDSILTDDLRKDFIELHRLHGNVFDGSSLGKYNGASGPLEIVINMGPTLPPQRKGKMPLYNRKLQEEYQLVCDKLEGTVLLKPEDVGITCEYLNPSFLVAKPNGGKRFVTAFGEVGQYSKPQPALMADINGVLRQIGNWKYVIKTDLTSAYWQLVLSRNSMKYCGVVTPFKGIQVYGRGAMGMPGTETALEELLLRKTTGFQGF